MSLDGKNKKALCKKDFRIGSSLLGFAEFIEGNWYEYTIEVHEETKIEIYYVQQNNIKNQPMTERTFRDNFDDLQQRREDRLNLILN